MIMMMLTLRISMLALRMMTMLMLGLCMMRMKTVMAEVFSEIPQLRVEKLEILQKGGTHT